MSNSPAGVDRLSEAVAQPYERCRRLTTTHLSQRVLAERWDISPRTLERWRWVGQGPKFLKLGGRVVYRLQDVEDYELEQLRSSTTA